MASYLDKAERFYKVKLATLWLNPDQLPLRNHVIRFTIRGSEGIIQEGVWSSSIPKRGESLSGLAYGLTGRLLFLGTDSTTSPRDQILYVRFLRLPD